jgi:hypothetical protein
MNLLEKRWLAFLRLARAKYLALEIPAFLTGFAAGGSRSYGYAVLGLIAIVLFLLVTSYSNTLSDRVEDAIDYPERSRMAEVAGYRALRAACGAAAVIYVVIVLLMVFASHMQPGWSAVWLLVLAMTGSYSVGPRFKTKRLISPIVCGGTTAGFLLLGYVGPGVRTSQHVFAGTFATLWIFGFCLYLVGYKDLGNISGDTAIGFRSSYWNIVSSHRPALRALAVVGLPYLVVVALTIAGELPASDMFVFLLIPFAVGYAFAITKGSSPDVGIAIRDLGNLYWQCFNGILLVGLYRSATTVLVVLAALLWYLVASFALHHDPPPLRWGTLKAVYEVTKRPGHRP